MNVLFDVKRDALLNNFIFPSPQASYKWDSFPGRLLCVAGLEGNVFPCVSVPSATIHELTWLAAAYHEESGEAGGGGGGDGTWEHYMTLKLICWFSTAMRMHVLVPEYPGYGMAGGRANEESVLANVRSAYHFALHGLCWKPEKILLVGRSVGTGVAIRLASELPIGGLALLSPFTSVKITAWLLAEGPDIFPSDQFIDKVICPTLIIHGSKDNVITSDHSIKLFDCLNARPKVLHVLQDLGHGNVELFFMAAKEIPRVFGLAKGSRSLSLEMFLNDPYLQGDTVASPIPAFDCKSKVVKCDDCGSNG
ncbi:hypothetical protein GUITHDRAFT_142470 [Guillardia theta CCMP2712]|uniref:Serine aminopeptidase S33 domain-containing protein n=1 Tax=Guillardia theta (strain CCMP2712) TaxID=905079 RepID=L1IX67_GUITC|nr:hypothetical protein GUITHDRAFT_142470 [Guillardia theta CCMP2712]EKX40853.1 hypothetical protein GUITHDRAFT_142470 [Guillardia theta CCMP2712]|eukprot:XP_005827833.1 hypothetical protein GUITHDRAFT_142470 [Guillardia theta CCMP2712]